LHCRPAQPLLRHRLFRQPEAITRSFFVAAVVVVLVLLGAVILALSVRTYRQTGNVAVVVYGMVIVISMVSGVIAAWRNLRREGRSHDPGNQPPAS
jgi:protein-S-isoprenylcysteine O-methyltransferase Ste14